MTLIASAWIAQDKALCRKVLDTWAQRTGFAAPRAGLIFVEPEKSIAGPGMCWIAAMPSTTVTGKGTAQRDIGPDRELLVDCLIYVQPGSVPPAGWEAALIGDFEAAVAWAAEQSGWGSYSLSHPTPIPPSGYQGQALWTLEGIQFRLKVA